MTANETNRETAAVLALGVLGWILSAPDRADRLLALTGLSPAQLRDIADTPDFQVALIAHLEAYEPDLLACAEALGVTPEALVAARHDLEG